MARAKRTGRRSLGRKLALAVAVTGACLLGCVVPVSAPDPPAPFVGDVGPVCTNSDKTACPRSYFTGPLGDNNLVPSWTGAFLIEYYDGVGTSWEEAKAALLERQTYLGRRFDGVHVQYGSGVWDGVFGMYDPDAYRPRREQWIIDNGSFAAVSWTPDYTIGQMNQGEADAIWAKAAEYWKSYAPHRIMLRPFAEFNMPHVSSAVPSPENGEVDYCGAPFITAWQRMVRVFQDSGAHNVGFWFTPDEGNNQKCAVDSYPGDSFVDWVGSDFYNRCMSDEDDCYSTPLHAGPARFGELFNYSGACASGETCNPNLHDLLGPRKPFVVGEVGTIYDSNQPDLKSDFYRSVAHDAKEMRYLRGISFFDADVRVLEGPRAIWRIDHPLTEPGIYEAFRVMANDPWFTDPGT